MQYRLFRETIEAPIIPTYRPVAGDTELCSRRERLENAPEAANLIIFYRKTRPHAKVLAGFMQRPIAQ